MPQLEEELRDLQKEDQKNEAQVAIRMKKRARKSAEKQVSIPFLVTHACHGLIHSWCAACIHMHYTPI
jgi:hypothetical protein